MLESREFVYKHRHFKKGATKEDVIPVLQKVKKDFNGRRFTAKEYSEWRKVNGGPTTITIKKVFGSFEEALESIGSKKEADYDIMELARKDLGNVISRTDYEIWRKNHSYAPSSQKLCKTYGGTWNDVAASLGFYAKKRPLAHLSKAI